MKTFLKWSLSIIGGIVVILVALVAWILISHSRFGWYDSGGTLDAARSGYDVVSYDIQLRVDAPSESLDGLVTVQWRATRDIDSLDLDLINNFNVSDITLSSGGACAFSHSGNKLRIALPRTIERDELASLTVRYRGKPTEAIMPPWIGGFNWSKDADGFDWIGLSCQGEGAKIWMPCKDHPSDEPDSVAIRITVPAGYICVSNGLLRDVTQADTLRTFHWVTHYPINNYSITVNIGRFLLVETPYVTLSGDTMPVQYYVLPQSRAKADSLLLMAVDMLKSYRKFFGEYPWAREKFAIVETAYLGMEHQTINSYGNHYNYDRTGGVTYDELMLHEMAHEWWGNNVTVRDWGDFWIHEGIGTYAEALYLLDRGGESAYHAHMRKKRNLIANKKPIVQGEGLAEEDAYHGDIYYKGAYVMHTLRYVLGDSVFFPMLKDFAANPRYTRHNQVTTDDFVEHVSRVAGRDWSALLNLYLRTTTIPEIRIDSVGPSSYDLSIPNIDFTLPIDVRLDSAVVRLDLGPTPRNVATTIHPVVDERHWYLTRPWPVKK